MIRVGVGQSTNPRTEEAAEQAASSAMAQAGIQGADGAVVFCTVDHFKSSAPLLAALRRVTGTSRIAGSSGAGILTGNGEIEGSSGLAVLVFSSDRIQCSPFLFHPLKGRDETAGAELARMATAGEGSDSLLLLFPDSYNGQPHRLLSRMESEVSFMPVIGAGSSENGSHGATYQVSGEQVATNAVAGLQLRGSFDCMIDFTQGCQPVTEPMVITKSDQNLIFEIDHRPAFDVFAQVIKGPLLDDLRRALAYVFVGLGAGSDRSVLTPGQYLVRNIVGLDPDQGILAIGEQVSDGDALIFALRDAQRAREDLQQMLERQVAKLGGQSPDFGFYFNCCARGTSLYGIPGIDTAYIRRLMGDIPLMGFFGGFELAPVGKANHLLAYTGVLALIKEKK